MAALTNKTIGSTYKDLLTVSGSTAGEGLESSLKTVVDGDGVESAIQLSTTTLKIPSGKTLNVEGTFTTANVSSGGGYGDTGVTLSATGNIQANGALTVDGSMTSDSATIGGGYGSTGTTITSAGNIQTNGLLLVGGTSTLTGQVDVGGGYSGGSGLTISTSGEITTTNNITCSAIRTTTGEIKSSSATSPKIKVDDDSKIVLTVEKTGTATFKDEDGDTKFTVKDNGAVKYKSKTTTELNSITGTSGEIVFDSTAGAFKIWSA